ncbi:MAG: protein kinase [Thermoanaerobaculia bacterium]
MIGKTLSHFKITAKLGAGGMGEVYRAEDTKLKREVALKVLPAELAGSQERLERFQREAETLAALDHPNIVTIHSVEQAEGVHFLTMQLVEGKPLSELIPENGLPIEQIFAIAKPLTEALAAAHEKGVIHRDLKPGNIMVTDDGRVKVLDFGLAKTGQLTGEEAHTQMATAPLTEEGRITGTLAYMSPEQLGGKDLGGGSDIFSLGVVLYEMATGKRPFGGDTPISTITAILQETPSSATSLRDALPPPLDSVLARCLEKDPQQRFRNAEELGMALRGVETDPADGGSRRPTVRFAIGALVLLIAILAGITFWPKGQEKALLTPTEVASEQTQGPSIAVLPFSNASGDPKQEYLSNGLTEELITQLSKYQELLVVARTSTLEYKDQSVDVRTVGESLGVRYVLQGSVQTAGDKIRLTAQLSDTRDGRQLWGESYDRDLTASDLFSLQDELTGEVLSAIAGSYGALFQAELAQARRKPPANLDAYDCVLRVYDYLQIHSPDKHLAARDCLELVVDEDTDYVDALAWLAYLYGEEYHHRWNARPDEYDALDRAQQVGEKAVKLDAVSQVAHGCLALTLFMRGDYDHATIEAQRAVDLNPRNALWQGLMGLYLCQLGDSERGLPMVRDAIQLSPHPPPWFHMATFYDHFLNGRYNEALAEARVLNWDGDFRIPLFLAATYGQLGRADEAAAALAEFRTLWTLPVEGLRAELIERHAIAPELTDRLLEGLAKAGLEGLSGS